MYNLGGNADLKSETGYTALQTRLRTVVWQGTDKQVYNIPVALSIMVFFASVRSMRPHAGGHSPRNKLLALACVRVRLYDHFGLHRR